MKEKHFLIKGRYYMEVSGSDGKDLVCKFIVYNVGEVLTMVLAIKDNSFMIK